MQQDQISRSALAQKNLTTAGSSGRTVFDWRGLTDVYFTQIAD